MDLCGTPEYNSSNFSRGLRKLPVRLTPGTNIVGKGRNQDGILAVPLG